MRVAGEPCPNCGFLPQAPPKPIAISAGELGLVQGGRAQAPKYDYATKFEWLGMLTHIGQERGYSSKFPTANYKAKFGEWPPWGSNPQPITPSPEVRSWVRSRMIAYAKGRGSDA